jgi:hypothetical protein
MGLLACAQETLLLPRAGDDSVGSSGSLQRFALDVEIVPAPDDAVGLVLGWGNGIPAATVVLEQGGGETDTALTDLTGWVRFTGLIEGRYRVSAVRILSEGERAATGLTEVYALGGGTSAVVLRADDSLRITARTGRRGSLTITEIRHGQAVYPGIGSYPFSFFIEVYNNGNTTAYLDGLLLGYGWFKYLDNVPPFSCADYAGFVDPEGLWAEYIFRFPGSGQQYPLPAGGVAVIATDAIDHSAAVPNEPNLARAQFEFVGEADVDNPSAANMLTVGPREYTIWGRGFIGSYNASAVFLARSVALGTLPATRDSSSGRRFLRIPRDSLVDVASYVYDPVDPIAPRCPNLVAPEIDEGVLHFGNEPDISNPRSMQRLVLATLPGGQVLMQLTGATARDFTLAPRTPFALR